MQGAKGRGKRACGVSPPAGNKVFTDSRYCTEGQAAWMYGEHTFLMSLSGIPSR